MLRANTPTGSVSVEKNILTLQKGCNINTVKTAIILTYSLWDIWSIYTCIMCFIYFTFVWRVFILYLDNIFRTLFIFYYFIYLLEKYKFSQEQKRSDRTVCSGWGLPVYALIHKRKILTQFSVTRPRECPSFYSSLLMILSDAAVRTDIADRPYIQAQMCVHSTWSDQV